MSPLGASSGPLVLYLESTVLADVPQMRRDGFQATLTTRHLDHHLRHPAHNRRRDALANCRGALSFGGGRALTKRSPG